MNDPMRDSGAFFIGWQPRMPGAYARPVRMAVAAFALVSVLVASLLVLSQRGFETSVFEFGKISTNEGILVLSPVPMLKVVSGTDAEGKVLYNSLLLVGAGKMGADTALHQMALQMGQPLAGKTLKLRGTLIYYQGKTALELSEGASAFAGLEDNSRVYMPDTEELGDISLRGEILDPKCALGVMKPGHGKPHLSCAVRCISGGIPALLRVAQKSGETRYVILLNEDRRPAGPQVLAYVAEQVQVCGRLERQDDWLLLVLSAEDPVQRLQPRGGRADVAMCGG
ncbi:MAG: hypothetical protein EAZ89_16755 [Bacteroidetes bacterium]|nr:MAG: hypothetical protein EAZ89_16755 [Bacteroidota bacterium]